MSPSTLANLRGVAAPPRDWPEALRVQVLDQPSKAGQTLDDPAHTVIWLEEAPAEQVAAWEMIENGRYMPRRICGSVPGRELG